MINRLIATQIAARRREMASTTPSSDVLVMLLAARDGAPDASNATLSAQEVHDNCMILFGAGFDTTSTALTWWIGLMATHSSRPCATAAYLADCPKRAFELPIPEVYMRRG